MKHFAGVLNHQVQTLKEALHQQQELRCREIITAAERAARQAIRDSRNKLHERQLQAVREERRRRAQEQPHRDAQAAPRLCATRTSTADAMAAACHGTRGALVEQRAAPGLVQADRQRSRSHAFRQGLACRASAGLDRQRPRRTGAKPAAVRHRGTWDGNGNGDKTPLGFFEGSCRAVEGLLLAAWEEQDGEHRG